MQRTRGENIFSVFNTIILLALVLACVYPFLFVVFSSFSEPNLLIAHSGILLSPLGFTLEGYQLVLKNPNIQTGYANTLLYVVVGTFINLLFTTLGAYCLSRRRLLWGKLMMFIVTFTMFFNGGLIPTYLLIKNLGMVNTRWALLIPGAIWVWNLIVMRTSFQGIPDSLEESAHIDGANDVIILIRIIIPVSKAVIAVMILFYSVGHWNSWFNAMIYLRDRTKYPLQLILREILIANDTTRMQAADVTDPTQLGTNAAARALVQYSTIIVATVPILFVYPFAQKYFIKGVMIGSLKG